MLSCWWGRSWRRKSAGCISSPLGHLKFNIGSAQVSSITPCWDFSVAMDNIVRVLNSHAVATLYEAENFRLNIWGGSHSGFDQFSMLFCCHIMRLSVVICGSLIALPCGLSVCIVLYIQSYFNLEIRFVMLCRKFLHVLVTNTPPNHQRPFRSRKKVWQEAEPIATAKYCMTN